STKKRLTAADAADVVIKRKPTGIEMFDYILSGGFVKKFVILFGGPKGSGKTSLMMQVLKSYCDLYKHKAVFASNEEYAPFVLANLNRVGAVTDRIEVMGVDEIDDVTNVIERCREVDARVGVFDSLQTLGFEDMPASAQRDVAVAHAINEHCKKS